jgi:hypothetical protein
VESGGAKREGGAGPAAERRGGGGPAKRVEGPSRKSRYCSIQLSLSSHIRLRYRLVSASEAIEAMARFGNARNPEKENEALTFSGDTLEFPVSVKRNTYNYI